MFPTFYDMKNQFWAGTCEKKVWGRLWATFEGGFYVFKGKKNENIIASALKSCIEKGKQKSRKIWEVYFMGEKPVF